MVDRQGPGRRFRFAVFGFMATIGTVAFVSAVVSGDGAGLAFVGVWLLLLAGNGYWSLTRWIMRLKVTDGFLVWETPTRSGSIPVSAITAVRVDGFAGSRLTIEHTLGPALRAFQAQRFQPVLDELAEQRPASAPWDPAGIQPPVGRIARIVDRVGTGGGAALTLLCVVLAFGVGMAACVGPAMEVAGYSRLAVPDRRTLTVTDPGVYRIYHEYDGAPAYDDEEAPELTVLTVDRVRGSATDLERVELRAVHSDKGQHFGGRDADPIYEFDATEGKYVITVEGDATTADGDPVDIAIGKDKGLKFMFLLLFPAFGLVVLAIAIASATIARRRRRAQLQGWSRGSS